MKKFGMLLLVLLMAPLRSPGAEKAADLPPSAKQTIDFARDVEPILKEKCLRCHGAEKAEANLRLDRRANLLRGGDSGEPAVKTGESAASHLIRAVAGSDPDFVMPPEGERLSAEQIGLLRAWIDQGLSWPGQPDSDLAAEAKLWSLQPLRRPLLPPISAAENIANPIDAFIAARRAGAGLSASPEADRVTLIRRLYFVLHGLPPSPEAVEDFAADSRPDAYERLVDRELASPRYGERWARHWLDVVRYAETNGFETNRERPNAFPYRDYVIESFNSDKPYDRFVVEQLAGDVAGAGEATGFLVAGAVDIVKGQDGLLSLTQRQNELADMINTTGTAFLGLTTGCARCHNHKFDPITQQDYYAWAAVFAGVQHGERPVRAADAADRERRLAAIEARLAELRRELQPRLGNAPWRPPVNVKHNVERFAPLEAKFVRFTIDATNGGEPCLDELEIFSAAAADGQPAVNLALAERGAKATASGVFQDGSYPIHQLPHVHDGRYGNGRSWIAKGIAGSWVQIELPRAARIERIEWSRDREEKFADRVPAKYRIEAALQPGEWQTVASSDDRLPAGASADERFDQQVAALATADEKLRAIVGEWLALRAEQKQLPLPTLTAYAGTFQSPGTTFRLFRGDPQSPREPVGPDTLQVLGSLALPAEAAEAERRLALARNLASKEKPLLPRVIVNRLWQYHFGTGLVATPSDFGGNGRPPSHPELLDWLAVELIDSGFSLKHVQRLIVTSATFRQSSAPRADALAADAGCRWLWRFPPRRLEAEAIRDSMLAAAGTIDLRMGGPGFSVFDVQLENVRHYFPKQQFGPAEWRRAVYMTKVRQEPDGVFSAFDCPDGNQVMAQRSRSTTPLQALNLLNSEFALQQADLFARRLESESGGDPRGQVIRANRLAFGRTPSAEELTDSAAFIAAFGLPAFCRAILNSNEFLFVP